MSGNWQVKEIVEVCKVVNGGTSKIGADEYYSSARMLPPSSVMGSFSDEKRN